MGALQSVAPSLGVELRPVAVRDAGEIERTVTAFAREANSGLIVTAGAGVATNRELIIKLAARYRLPAVYPYRYYVASGGLMSYGPDNVIIDAITVAQNLLWQNLPPAHNLTDAATVMRFRELVRSQAIRSALEQIKSIVSITARTETALRGWACRTRTQKCRRKLSL